MVRDATGHDAPSACETGDGSASAAAGYDPRQPDARPQGAASGPVPEEADWDLSGTGWYEAVPLLAAGRHLEVSANVERLRRGGRVVFPPRADVFRALVATPWDSVRVVVLGQDPYHGAGQAHGLAFSVPEGVAPPRSLRNIFREIAEDVGAAGGGGAGSVVGIPDGDSAPEASPSTDLTRWARQGVLLLNTVLTVEEGKAHSHAHIGWQEVTGAIIEALGRRAAPLAFLLWGRHAAACGEGVAGHHLVLHAAHPSPLSASRGFFGCRHFSKVNGWLRERCERPIAW